MTSGANNTLRAVKIILTARYVRANVSTSDVHTSTGVRHGRAPPAFAQVGKNRHEANNTVTIQL